jgi:hypothetical protein
MAGRPHSKGFQVVERDLEANSRAAHPLRPYGEHRLIRLALL